MDISREFANPDLEVNGVWVEYRDDSRVKVARLNNHRWRSAHDKLMEPYRTMQQRGTMPTELQDKVLCRAMAQAVLLDWENFTKNGQPLKYSEDAAFDLLWNHLTFRNEIVALAANEDYFKAEAKDDAAKN